MSYSRAWTTGTVEHDPHENIASWQQRVTMRWRFKKRVNVGAKIFPTAIVDAATYVWQFTWVRIA